MNTSTCICTSALTKLTKLTKLTNSQNSQTHKTHKTHSLTNFNFNIMASVLKSAVTDLLNDGCKYGEVMGMVADAFTEFEGGKPAKRRSRAASSVKSIKGMRKSELLEMFTAKYPDTDESELKHYTVTQLRDAYENNGDLPRDVMIQKQEEKKERGRNLAKLRAQKRGEESGGEASDNSAAKMKKMDLISQLPEKYKELADVDEKELTTYTVPELREAWKTGSLPTEKRDSRIKAKKSKMIVQDETEESNVKKNTGGRKTREKKAADASSKFYVADNTQVDDDADECAGFLASGKKCGGKSKEDCDGLCGRCSQDLKENKTIYIDSDMGDGTYYRDVVFKHNDPNGNFKKGDTVRQYAPNGTKVDFNGREDNQVYQIFTEKDGPEFEYCSFVATGNPFVKQVELEEFDVSKYELNEEDQDSSGNEAADEGEEEVGEEVADDLFATDSEDINDEGEDEDENDNV